MYEPASLGMFQCRLQRILCDFEVIMFFRKDPPQTEGRRHADLLIKTEPVGAHCRAFCPVTLPDPPSKKSHRACEKRVFPMAQATFTPTPEALG